VLVPSGDQWPRFLYRNFEYDPDDPWEGLFRSGLLLSVRLLRRASSPNLVLPRQLIAHTIFQAFKHVFTSPSSVTDSRELRATKTCNASRHGMTQVTIAALAYIATQVSAQTPLALLAHRMVLNTKRHFAISFRFASPFAHQQPSLAVTMSRIQRLSTTPSLTCSKTPKSKLRCDYCWLGGIGNSSPSFATKSKLTLTFVRLDRYSLVN
jgi:hypothetical protein